MNYKDDNMEIIRLLVNYINQCPEQRFGQILRNAGSIKEIERPDQYGLNTEIYWTNEFYANPKDITERIKKEMSNE